MDEGEQLVGDIRATAADLVEERHLGLPDRPRGRGIANGAGIIRDGESDEIVELEDAGVVVPEGEAECVGEPHQQQRFRGAVIAHEQQRLFGGECGQERGLEGVVAHDAERAEEGAGRAGWRVGRRRGAAGDGGGSRLASHARDRDCHGDTSAQELRRARHHAGRRDVSGPL